MKHHFILDVEASDKTLSTGYMTEFALAHLESESTFYAHLYKFTPHPDTPALPVVTRNVHGEPVEDIWFAVDGKTPHEFRPPDFQRLVGEIDTWIDSLIEDSDRVTLVSDNNGFDAMWLNCFTDAAVGRVLFGHSSRRIGDFYAGTRGRWNDQSS